MFAHDSFIIGYLFGRIVGVFLVLIFLHIPPIIPFYFLFKKAHIERAWLAFIPIVQVWPFFWSIKKSVWNIVWGLIPLFGFIAVSAVVPPRWVSLVIVSILFVVALRFEIIWMIEFFQAFGMSPLWLLIFIGGVVPILNVFVGLGFTVLLYIMAFNGKYQYQLADC